MCSSVRFGSGSSEVAAFASENQILVINQCPWPLALMNNHPSDYKE